MTERHPDSVIRREISRRSILALGAGASAGVALGLTGLNAGVAAAATGTTYYVSTSGSDSAAGTSAAPLKTINAAAQKAQPGDTVLVRSGTYREEVVLPRGGSSDTARITFAPDTGASVTITGSDLYTTWTKVSGDVWKLDIPNSDFNGFNPYAKQVSGDWFTAGSVTQHLGMVYLNGAWLPEAADAAAVSSNAGASWWPSAGASTTTITAKFPGVDPNKNGAVEVGMRGTVFKPAATNYNYITIRGFKLVNAATNWAAPTMGQWGLVSAYWCKGWVIEDNEIAFSRCCGVALGKYSDQYDGQRGTTTGYYDTITDAQRTGGWTYDAIGSHVVRNNTIHHCGQTGIVGSLGGIRSTITGNEIYEIDNQGIWGGAEMAGIKLHAAIDTVISGNHIYKVGGYSGIWLDWMAQGTQVTGNLMHDNRDYDIFAEVDHGPLLMANNVMLSPGALRCFSDGVAGAHNLVTGSIYASADSRTTPYFQPHTTTNPKAADGTTTNLVEASIPIGAQQWANNILGGSTNLSVWDSASSSFPISMKANVYTKGATQSSKETGGVDASSVTYSPGLVKSTDGWYLTVPRVETWRSTQAVVNTSSLVNAPRPNQTFTNPDDSSMSVSTDFLGKQRSTTHPFPGPFESDGGTNAIKVWSRVVPTTDAWGRSVTTVSGPGAATDANGVINVHVHGTDNGIWQTYFNGTSWSAWTSLGGPNAGTFVGTPAVTSKVGRTDIFVRGTDNALWQKTWTTSGWGNWTSLGGGLADSPGAATDPDGKITVHVRGTDNQIYQNAFNGTSWSGWGGLGGPTGGVFTGAPALTA
ncbi:right-handed parallel beta-helix repeat-containing protein, partial [Streptomyces tubercidicus]|uniref:right-handed parallel beta-helix repeat-containing protein n=1 Tax=Streptomyces tubercidicus TaxID=47759 RepID=UPI0036CB4C04